MKNIICVFLILFGIFPMGTQAQEENKKNKDKDPYELMSKYYQDDFNPFNIVFFFHRMRDITDFYLNAAVDFFNDRNMLFLGCINRIFNQFFHRLSAADQLAPAAVQNLNDIPTELTFINFQSFCHVVLLLFFIRLAGWPVEPVAPVKIG